MFSRILTIMGLVMSWLILFLREAKNKSMGKYSSGPWGGDIKWLFSP